MDLYALLGVARSASDDDIERAYRRLARRFHPGVNPGDSLAAETYRQIQQAYDVLKDAQRRREYDAGRAARPAALEAEVSFTGFDFSTQAEGPLAATFSELFADVFQDAARRAAVPDEGADLSATLPLSFEDAVRGGQFPMSIVRQERCAACGGDGRVARPALECPHCHGEGSQRWARGYMVFTKTCEGCGGAGRVTSQPCGTCGGAGIHPRSEVVTVAVPSGVEDGTRIVVPGRGHAGAHGGPAGDLYVLVQVSPHRVFRRVGRDLVMTLPIAVHEAALGARVEVPTLDGMVRLRIPPGTSSGRQFRIAGRGVPASDGGNGPVAGDLVVDVQIALPPLRDERSRELVRELARLNPADVRRELFEY